MIGSLDYWDGPRRLSVSLDDALVWRSVDPALAERMNERFPGKVDEEVPTVVLGRHLLYQAAERLGGTVRVRSLRVPELAR